MLTAVDYSFAPSTLTWDDVDPGRHPFDADAAPGLVRGLAPASAVPTAKDGDAWADAMTRAIVEVYGPWACGWRWAGDEGDIGGGPIASWCCPSHSIAGTEVTLRRVTNALVEWRDWLEDLAGRFDRYPLSGADQHAVWERGAVHLIHHVVDRTHAGDAWYQHCAQVLTWFLARWGVPAGRAESLVDQAIGGRFESWTGPDESLVDDIAGQLASAASDQSRS